VWSKIEPNLNGVDYVFLSPDGDMNLLSFASLPCKDGSYLGEKYVFNTIASGRDLLRKPIDAGGKPEFVVFADPEFSSASQTRNVVAALPGGEVFRSAFADRGIFGGVNLPALPGTREEANAAAALFKTSGIDAKAFFGADATETAVKSVSKPGYLLLATHGFFLQDPSWTRERKDTSGFGGDQGPVKVSLALENPMHRSGLAFAGAQRAIKGDAIPEGEDDGLLTAEEVVTMDIEGTKLVNLSACETGLGEVRRGEGVMGLRRAFVMAGCNALVMSLWNVPDKSTQELMNSFYQQYLKTGDPVRSLAEAQRSMLKTRRANAQPTNPYYWGAFAVTSVVR
jgi:CHAT domain-containing protein